MIMSLTGLFLCSFVLVHLIGNFQLLKHDNGYSFNTYAVFMTTNPLIKFISYGLYAMILIHALRGITIVLDNKSKRKIKYAVYDGSANSSWQSRNMGLLGSILFIFIAIHMYNFWWQYHNAELPYTQYDIVATTGEMTSKAHPALDIKKAELPLLDTDGNVIGTSVIVKDLQQIVDFGFKNIILVIFYVIAMFALSFHLIHGFKSAFQSLGINHPKYNGIFKWIGIIVFGIFVPFAFAIMPLYIYFK